MGLETVLLTRIKRECKLTERINCTLFELHNCTGSYLWCGLQGIIDQQYVELLVWMSGFDSPSWVAPLHKAVFLASTNFLISFPVYNPRFVCTHCVNAEWLLIVMFMHPNNWSTEVKQRLVKPDGTVECELYEPQAPALDDILFTPTAGQTAPA